MFGQLISCSLPQTCLGALEASWLVATALAKKTVVKHWQLSRAAVSTVTEPLYHPVNVLSVICQQRPNAAIDDEQTDSWGIYTWASGAGSNMLTRLSNSFRFLRPNCECSVAKMVPNKKGWHAGWRITFGANPSYSFGYMLVVVALFGTKSMAAFFPSSGPEPNREMPNVSGMPLAETAWVARWHGHWQYSWRGLKTITLSCVIVFSVRLVLVIDSTPIWVMIFRVH